MRRPEWAFGESLVRLIGQWHRLRSVHMRVTQPWAGKKFPFPGWQSGELLLEVVGGVCPGTGAGTTKANACTGTDGIAGTGLVAAPMALWDGSCGDICTQEEQKVQVPPGRMYIR